MLVDEVAGAGAGTGGVEATFSALPPKKTRALGPSWGLVETRTVPPCTSSVNAAAWPGVTGVGM